MINGFLLSIWNNRVSGTFHLELKWLEAVQPDPMNGYIAVDVIISNIIVADDGAISLY